jgi:inner membrane protein
LKGSEGVQFAPLGDETVVTVTSPWERPSFIGAYPPSDRTLGTDGFSAAWNVSSFGRSYPHTWYSDVPVSRDTIRASLFGVSLHEGVDLYTQVSRSVTYAVLFILVTFTVFFLFEILTGLRLHPVQYLLIGSALALFYLLLLSLAEHIGFPLAYAIATSMIILLITGYSVSVLQQKIRALLIFFVLLALYGYLYFVLSLEDYALLFGSLLVFALLASVMYLTRRIDWYALGKSGTDTNHATDMSPKV